MDKIKKKVTKSTLLRWGCLVFIIIWPLYNSFLGIDMVDTGYYLYQYDTPLSSYGTYTTYLATLIGAVWLKLFGSLGLWGLNLLEIILEWGTCIVVYRTFKGRFGENSTIFGIAVAMAGISTYVNIFNYHQLNMSLCCIMLCFMYRALSKNKKLDMFLAGCMGALAVTCRMPSILTLVCILCIIYWNLRVEKFWKGLSKRILLFLSGYVVIAISVFLFLHCFGLLDTIMSEIFRLNNLGSADSAAYGVSSMLINLIRDTALGLAAAVMFTLCMFGFALVDEWKRKSGKVRKAVFILYSILMLPLIYLAVYVVGQAPPFVQLTSFSWFLYGMCVEVALYYIIKGLVAPRQKDGEDGVIAMMAIALILLCVVGSAARAKHTILGLWIIVPFVVEKFRKLYQNPQGIERWLPIVKKKISLSHTVLKQTVIVIVCVSIIVFVHFIAVTNNFDSTQRRELTATIDSDKMKYVKTTERQADAVNTVLNKLEDKKDSSLMVVGNAVMFYYLTGMDSYVRPWVSGTSYTYNKFSEDIWYRVGKSERRPIVLICKTDPYRGFSKNEYENLYKAELDNNYSGKKELVYEFLDHYEYDKFYENDYFILYEPNSEKEMEIWR